MEEFNSKKDISKQEKSSTLGKFILKIIVFGILVIAVGIAFIFLPMSDWIRHNEVVKYILMVMGFSGIILSMFVFSRSYNYFMGKKLGFVISVLLSILFIACLFSVPYIFMH